MNMRKKPSKDFMLESIYAIGLLSARVLNILSPHYYKHFRKGTISTSSNHIFSLTAILSFFFYLQFSNNQQILSEFGAQKERVHKQQ